jgi:thiol-disulfide isomerase/thioredoxin
MMTPVFEELSDSYKDTVIFVKVDVDKAEVRGAALTLSMLYSISHEECHCSGSSRCASA